MVGQIIWHYRIVEKLDGVGLGVSYKAEDIHLHRVAALRFLPDNVAKDSQAFAVSAVLSDTGLCNPHVLPVISTGEKRVKHV